MNNNVKLSRIFALLFVCFSIFLLGFNNSVDMTPKTLYQVYLDGESIGIIESEDKLKQIMNKEQVEIKDKYNVDSVYIPEGVEVKKMVSFSSNVSTEESIYKKLITKKDFTVRGYEITVKYNDENSESSTDSTETETSDVAKREDVVIYVLDKKVFDDALESTIKAFVKEKDYKAYIDGTQTEIDTVGSIIEDIDKSQQISYKEDLISTNKTIWTEPEALARYLLYGSTKSQETYVVKDGETIDDIASKYKLNSQEFLIANPNFTSSNNLLYPGQVVNVGLINPVIDIVVMVHSVEQREKIFQPEIQYDQTKAIGYEEVVRGGENGLVEVVYKYRYINGQLSESISISQSELKPAINSIIIKGSKYVPNMADASYWAWPTNTPCNISSGYAYRTLSGVRDFHSAIDITGTGYGSPIYASNNGEVVTVDYKPSGGGNYVVIKHNYKNYYTSYLHMKEVYVKVGEIVSRGQKIGAMGNTGWVSPKPTPSNPTGGTHLHFGVFIGHPYQGGTHISPWTILKTNRCR